MSVRANVLEFRLVSLSEIVEAITGKPAVGGGHSVASPNWTPTLTDAIPTRCDMGARFHFRPAPNAKPNRAGDTHDFYRIRLRWPTSAAIGQAAICEVAIRLLPPEPARQQPSRKDSTAATPGSIKLEDVTPPDGDKIGGIPMAGALINANGATNKPRWIWWTEWFPYSLTVEEFTFAYFDLSGATKVDRPLEMRKDPKKNNQCFQCTYYKNAKRREARVRLVTTHMCLLKAYKPKSDGRPLLTWVLDTALPYAKIAWAAAQVAKAARDVDPVGFFEALFQTIDAIKDVADPPPKPKYQYGFTFARPMHRYRASTNYSIDYTNWTTGAYIRCDAVLQRNERTGNLEPTYCAQSPNVPNLVWTPDPDQVSEWDPHPIVRVLSPSFDVVEKLDDSSKIPYYYNLEGLKTAHEGLFPWNPDWHIVTSERKLSDPVVQASPCFENLTSKSKDGFVIDSLTKKWLPVGMYSESLFPHYFTEEKVMNVELPPS